MSDGKIFNRVWIVTAAWAHPLWHQYAVLLYDLHPRPPLAPAVKYRSDVTHEFMLFAMDPDRNAQDVDAVDSLDKIVCEGGIKLLQPTNHAYQFTCPSDEQAQKWVQSLVDLIKAVKLNPDTDGTRAWNEIFAHGVTLKSSIFSEQKPVIIQ